jgi:dihydrofolate reductase
MTARVGLIWAQAEGGVIGREGAMPWHVPEDMAHFAAVTAGHPVIMGRKTWDSLPEKFRPLPGRRNIVITRQSEWQAEGAERAGSLDDALARLDGRVWVMGGAQIYREALDAADLLEVTELDLTTTGDAFAPDWRSAEAAWAVESDPAGGWHTSRTGIRYRFLSCTRSTI